MSGTSGSLSVQPDGASGLPVPHIRTNAMAGTLATFVSDGGPSSGSDYPVNATTHLESVAINLPSDLFKLEKGLKLELLRYVPRHSRSGNPNHGGKQASYRHPANFVPSGNGSGTHGGDQGGVGSILPRRITEWDITSHGQVVDLTDACHAFMAMVNVSYRDSAANVPSVQCICPANGNNSVSMGSASGRRRFPYAPVFFPGYFKFRYSILDPNRPSGKQWRITGPESVVVSLTNNVFPFASDVSVIAPNGALAAASIAANYKHDESRFFIGPVSRLPR